MTTVIPGSPAALPEASTSMAGVWVGSRSDSEKQCQRGAFAHWPEANRAVVLFPRPSFLSIENSLVCY